jgi:vacuolar protein sorting-associated protein IST1
MPSTSQQTIKLKSTLRLLIPRLRMAQKKDTSLSIAARREMADLLSQHREQSARIRVENIIATDTTVELMEILELYCELLLARAGLLDDKSRLEEGGEGTGLEEAAASIIYSAPRLPRDVKELAIVRAMLIDRFGKEFGIKANENRDGIVPKRIVDKLKVDPPKEELVVAYLTEIARTYGVQWPRESEQLQHLQQEVDEEEDYDDDQGDGGLKETPILADGAPSTPKPRRTDLGRAYSKSELERATPPSDMAAKSPVSVAPPAPRIDNPSPRVNLPGGGAATKPTPPSAPTGGLGTGARKKDDGTGPGGDVPTVDDLARRFRELKR